MNNDPNDHHHAGELTPHRPDHPVHRDRHRPEPIGPLGSFRINSRARLQAGKAEAVAHVGGAAMQAVTWVTELEQELGRSCPAAAARVQGLAELTAYAVAEVVAETNQFLR